MARSRRESLRSGSRSMRPSTSVLLVALGAVAGVALGMVIADRAGGLDGLLGRGGARGGRRARANGWREDLSRSEPFDAFDGDDDTELSPESIAHMHVHGDTDEPTLLPAAPAAAGTPVTAPSVGTAPSRRLRRRETLGRSRGATATETATGAPAVRELPDRSAPDPAALEARVLEAFLNDPTLQERAIDICAADGGVVELTGWVQASWEIGHALTLARGVPDVHRVVDRLAVRGAEPAPDHSSTRYEAPPAH